MKLKLTLGYVLSFLALTFVMHEAHEIVHTSIGRVICGCWGERDFNVWGVCDGCSEENPIALLSVFAGPIFTFVMIWIGAFLINNKKTVAQKAFGFSLIFANLPFARILTAALGGGDEVSGIDYLIENRDLARIIGLVGILALTIFPLWKAFQLIENKRRILWFLLFFILPTFIDLLLVLGVMNSILEKGILSEYWILGSPLLVTVWTITVSLVYIFTRKSIYKLSLVEN